MELQTLSDEGSVYEATIDAAVEILGFDWCCIALPVEGYFELAYLSPDAPVEEGERYLQVDEGLTGKTLEDGETIHIDERDAHPESRPVKESFESLLSIPIEERGVFQGVSAETDAFDETDRELAELLIAHTCAALDRIDRERELQRQNERLERFAAVVSHDMRNPLQVAVGNLEIALETGDREYVETARDAIGRADRIVEDVLAVARGSQDPDPEPCDLDTYSRRAWSAVSDTGTTFESPESVRIRADPDGLLRLLENLIRNAVEHGGDQVAVTVTDGGFAVEDDGPGFPESADDVFDPGVTAESQTGLGLSICTDIAEAHGWDLSVDRDADRTRVVVDGVTFEDPPPGN